MLTTACSLRSYVANSLIFLRQRRISTFSRQYSRRETNVSHEMANTFYRITSISFFVLSRC
jgi:hypothetical protein